MTVQLLAQCGLGASHGRADAAGGHVERRRDVGVAEPAVPEHEGHGLLPGQPGECGADPAAFVEGDDGVGDVGLQSVSGGGLLTGSTPASGPEVVQGGVCGRYRQPSTRFAGWDGGSTEGQEDLPGDVLAPVPGPD